jgi:proteic killer suppression protein
MEVVFADDDFYWLETDPESTGNLEQPIVKAFRKRMQQIRAAPDERDFYKLKSLRFEKLEGKRKHQHSMRLNDQYRLIVELIKKNPSAQSSKVIKIVGIEDYH